MRGLALFLIAAAAISSPAAASVALRAEVEDLAETASVVADAVVLDHSASLDPAAGAISTSYRVRVTAALAGEVSGEIVVRVPGGRVGTVTQEMLGAPELEDGARVVLFLGPQADGARAVIGLNQGAFRVETDPATGAARCRNSLDGLSLVGRDGRTASAQPLELTIAEMTVRVAAGRARGEAKRRAASDALERRLSAWRRSAERHAAAARGRPGGSPL